MELDAIPAELRAPLSQLGVLDARGDRRRARQVHAPEYHPDRILGRPKGESRREAEVEADPLERNRASYRPPPVAQGFVSCAASFSSSFMYLGSWCIAA
jgi:hypothetical protein